MVNSTSAMLLYLTDDEDAEDRPATAGGEDDEVEEEDGTSRPAAGNTEGETVHMTKHEIREARGNVADNCDMNS